ncbi:MAG TPA: sugar phosphate isomerase/epimerase [Thermomicrobiales bacterium]|nr:sugar phosphate isomerase/epimerase [Thermomicrobiales bacterium]
MPQLSRLGVFETVYPRQNLEDSFRALVNAGFASVQFDLASGKVDAWAGPVDPMDLRKIVTAATATDVSIPAISGTYNMAHPDPAVRAAGLVGIQRVIEVAPVLGAAYVTLCTGSRSLRSMWHEHADNASAEAWRDGQRSIEAALETADRNGITLLVEPEPANVVGSAALARRMLDEVGHPRLKVVLDPANAVLSNLNRTPSDVLSEAFELLGEDIAFAHAKDLRANGTFCAAGTGIVPWPHYRSLLDGIDFQGDVIFHTLTEADVSRALEAWHGD